MGRIALHRVVNLAEKRREFGITQQQLAEMANVSIALVGNIERGIPTSYRSVTRLANALGIPATDLEWIPVDTTAAIL